MRADGGERVVARHARQLIKVGERVHARHAQQVERRRQHIVQVLVLGAVTGLQVLDSAGFVGEAIVTNVTLVRMLRRGRVSPQWKLILLKKALFLLLSCTHCIILMLEVLVLDVVVGVAVFPHDVSVTVGLGCEPERALGALEGLLAGVGQDVPLEAGLPGELAGTVGAGHLVRGRGVGGLPLAVPGLSVAVALCNLSGHVAVLVLGPIKVLIEALIVCRA